MIPVYQDDFTFTTGNCFSACLASLLELPLADVPKFMAEEDWFGAVNRWLAQFNLRFIDIKWSNEFAVWPDAGGYCLMTGPSPRRPELLHTVVVGLERGDDDHIRFRWLHDPHPDCDYLAGDPTSVGFLAVLDPVMFAREQRERKRNE